MAGHQPGLGMPHMVRLGTGLRQRMPNAEPGHRTCPPFSGKTQREMVQLALARTGFTVRQAVIIGDRLYTDVACGVNAGIDSIFVLSGEGVMDDIVQYRIQPTWIYQDIAQLYHELKETAT